MPFVFLIMRISFDVFFFLLQWILSKIQAFGNAQMYLTPFMYDPSAPLNYGEERSSSRGGETWNGI